jgi:hypothetical protein
VHASGQLDKSSQLGSRFFHSILAKLCWNLILQLTSNCPDANKSSTSACDLMKQVKSGQMH